MENHYNELPPELTKAKRFLQFSYPNSKIIKTRDDSLVAKQGDEYIKVFSQKGEREGKKQLYFSQKFSQFSNLVDADFDAPVVTKIRENLADPFHFVMQKGGDELNICNLEFKEILQLFEKYKSEIEKFEQFMKGETFEKTSDAKIAATLSKYQSTLEKFKFLKSYLNNQLTKKVLENHQNLIQIGLENFEKTENSKTFPQLASKIKQTFPSTKISQIPFEYGYGKFGIKPLFKQENFYRLIDFDKVDYLPSGVEQTILIYSKLISKADFFEKEDFLQKFGEYKNQMLENFENKKLLEYILETKIILSILHFGEKYGMKTQKGLQNLHQLLLEYYPSYK